LVETKPEWFEVSWKLQIFFFGEEREVGFEESPFRLCNFPFQHPGVDGALVDIEEGDVVEGDLVQQDDELDEIGVGLLPERFLARPNRLLRSEAMP